MRRFGGFLAALLCLSCLPHHSFAQDEDVAKTYFSAYQEFQRAERLEREGKGEEAISKFRFVATQLNQIKAQAPGWQPVVVDFRLRKTQEAIVRLEGSLANPTLGPPPDLVATDTGDVLPPVRPARREPAMIAPTISISPGDADMQPAAEATPPPPPPVAADSGEAEKLRGQLEAERRRSEDLAAQLAREQAEVKSASLELEKTKVSIVELNTQLQQLKEASAAAPPPADGESVDAKVKELQDALQAAEEEKKTLSARAEEATQSLDGLKTELEASRQTAEKAAAELADAKKQADEAKAQAEEMSKERESLVAARDEAVKSAEAARGEVAGLQEKVAELEKERGELLAAVDSAKQEAQEAKTALQKSEDLIAANKQLEDKLAAAAEQIASLENDAKAKAELVTGLQSDLDKVREELALAQQTLKDDRERFDKLQAVNDQLLKEYDEVTGQLAAVKLGDITANEAKLLQQENEVLRGIIMRQIKEQARREQAFRLAQEEMQRLEIKSDTLNDQINKLAKPTLDLSAAEQEMLKRPVVTVMDSGAGTIAAEVEVLKPKDEETPAPATASASPAPAEDAEDPTAPVEGTAQGSPAPAPAEGAPATEPPQETAAAAQSLSSEPTPEQLELIRKAREAFVRGNFADAERLYQKFVQERPDNVVGLANLAVAQFRQGKLTAAQLALEKAVKVDPNDSFSLTTLGAVLIEQNRIEDAVKALEQANQAKPDDPITLNYLGVATSQLGQFGKAEQALRRAISVKPDYSEAHFNLAVIYATAKPPSIALAKRHYEKALELGAGPDKRLAAMLQGGPGS